MTKLPTVSGGSGPRFVRHAGRPASIRVRNADGEEVSPDRLLDGASGASILLVRDLFVTSTPQTALARLVEAGVQVVIGPGFESQLHARCIAAGMLLLPLDEEKLERLAVWVETCPDGEMSIDLERQVIERSGAEPVGFAVDPRVRTKLLSGLTDLDEALRHASGIEALRAADRKRRPWLYDTR